jgi:UDP-N-acetylmuramate dehydrogenase
VGKLIEDAGLKGYTVGGAQISTKHAGFTVNCGNATSNDVRALIDYVKGVISSTYNVDLECEIIYVPYN